MLNTQFVSIFIHQKMLNEKGTLEKESLEICMWPQIRFLRYT
jgi:hypothetical protein